MAAEEWRKRKAEMGAAIRLGIVAEEDWEGPSVKPGELSEEQIDWLAAWLSGEGYTRSDEASKRAEGTQYVITGLHIDGLAMTYSEPHPERTPIGPFPSREAAWEYARQMQLLHGNGGGSVEVAPLVEPRELP